MSPIDAINASYQHIIDKDADAICDGYANEATLYVILEGPRLSNRGHKSISKGWRDFCAAPMSLESITWTEGPYEEEKGNMAWVGGVISLAVKVKGKVFKRIFRATFVLTKADDGDWKIKHEHVSAAMEDPYGIGDWLKDN